MDVDRRIVNAVLTLAATQTRPISIQSVSDTSGVAKTTIYRRYRNSEELTARMMTALAALIPRSLALEPSHGNIAVLLARFVQALDDHVDIRLLGLIIASDSPLVRQLKESIVIPTRRAGARFFRAGMDAGVFRRDVDIDVLMDNIIGSLVVASATAGEDIPSSQRREEWARKESILVWRCIAAKSGDEDPGAPGLD